MSSLFDDAERFEPHMVVGDTIRHVKDGTEEHVGPGTYSPSMANSKEFGFIGVSSSTRSNMDPPTSPRSSEHQRFANGSVVRDGVWFHTSPFLPIGPGPGQYSPSIMSSEHIRGKTAKPSTGQTGRQAWDLRGSAGGISLVSFREGFTVSSSMGNSPRMGDFSRVALRDGVLLLRGSDDGHRGNGIGPGTYDGASNRQDPMIKRSYNARAQCSQARRERSLSFSGTSSSVRAFLSLQSTPTCQEISNGRPDLHLLARHTHLNARAGSMSPRGDGRCVSPASAMLASMRARAAADAALGYRSGGQRARSLSPKRNRQSSPGTSSHGGGGVYHTWGFAQSLQGSGLGRSVSRGCRSMSPPPSSKRGHGDVGGDAGIRGGWGGIGSGSLARGRKAGPASPRRQKACSAPSSPRYRSNRNSGGRITGASGGSSYTFDYFGLAGQRGAWRGLETVSAARADVGIDVSHEIADKAVEEGGGGDNAEGEAGIGAGVRAPKSLLPEGVPKKGVCTPPKETREDLQKYFQAANITAGAVDNSSNLPLPPKNM